MLASSNQRRSDLDLPEQRRNAPVREMNQADTESVPVIPADTARFAQLASFCSFANGLSPSPVCMAAASLRFPVKIIRRLATAARTVSSPIQIAVMVLRSTDT